MTLYTGGTFDIFHSGHVNFLRMCKRISDRVVVSLNTDFFIKLYKGNFPINSYENRKAQLLGCRYVDEVVENKGNDDSKIAINLVRPDIIAIGTDWAAKDYYHQMGFDQKWLDDHDIVLVYLPYTPGISTTEIKERVKNQ